MRPAPPKPDTPNTGMVQKYRKPTRLEQHKDGIDKSALVFAGGVVVFTLDLVLSWLI